MMVIDAELWRGKVAPGMLGQRVLKACSQKVQPVANRVWQVTGTTPGARLDRASIDIDIDLPSGRRLTGTINDLVGGRTGGVQLLLTRGQAPDPVVDPVPRTVGGWPRPGDQSAPSGGSQWPPPARTSQCRPRVLDRLIDLRDRGLREVVPLPPNQPDVGADRLRWHTNGPKADAAADKVGRGKLPR